MTRYRMVGTLCLVGALHTAHARPQGIAEAVIPSALDAGAVEPIDNNSSSQPAVESSSLSTAPSVVATPSLAPSSAASVPSASPFFTKNYASPPASVSPSSPSLLPSIDSTSTGTVVLTTTVVTSIARPTSPSGYYSDYLLSSYSPASSPAPPVPTSGYIPVPVPAPSPAPATGAANATYGVPVDHNSGCRKHGYHGHGHYGNGTRTGSPGTGGAASGSGVGGAAPGSGAGHESSGGAGAGGQSGWDGEGNQHHDTAAPDQGAGNGGQGSEPLAQAGAGTVGVRVLGVVVPGLLSLAFLV